jgi:guanylate kinase
MSEEEFAAAEERGEFLQTAVIAGHRFGVRRSDLEEALAKGKGVYLILNKDGASAIKRLYGERVVRLFMYVDKMTLRERLESKGTPYELVEEYMDNYIEEVRYRKSCEHVFEFLDLERTLSAIRRTLKQYLPGAA